MNNLKIEVVGRLNQLAVFHRMKIYKVASESGLYAGQKIILDFILRNDRCTQKEIAERLFVSQPSIAASVKRMEKAGLITREQDEKDLRINRLSATKKGAELAEKCRMDFDAVDNGTFNGFTEEELKAIKNYLDRMILNVTGSGFSHENFCRLMAEEKEFLKEKHGKEIV